jgi:TRAP-type mannitol/chloroaromatic compound transport system substrate-binding protein
LPFGPEADEYMAWMFYGNGLKLAQQMYDEAGYQIITIPAALLVPETSGWFTKPINSVEDLKGMKMRFYGYGGEVMQKLGMSIALLPPAELFPALEKKVLDATEFSMPTIDHRLGFYKIAKYNYFPGWHQQASFVDLIVSKKKWDKLSKGQQTTLRMACMAGITNSIAEGESSQGAVVKANKMQRGVNNMYWSQEMLDTFKAKWMEVASELKQKDAFFAKAYDDLMKFREEYAFWQSKGFLPRGCE